MFPTRLMLCVDGPETLESSTLEISWLAGRFGVPVLVYHAVWPYWSERLEDREVRDAEAARLEALVRSDTFAGLQIDVICNRAAQDLVPGLLGAAATARADLIVIPTHRRRGLERLIDESVAERVARSCSIPTLSFDLERIREAGKDLGVDQVIAPVDFSKPSDGALAKAFDVAAKLACPVSILHSINPVPIPFDPGGVSIKLHQQWCQGAEHAMESLATRLAPDVPWTTRVSISPTVTAILEVAAEWRNPMIVMATAGRDSVGDHILGSRAERTIRRARCSVLSLPPAFTASLPEPGTMP